MRIKNSYLEVERKANIHFPYLTETITHTHTKFHTFVRTHRHNAYDIIITHLTAYVKNKAKCIGELNRR